jgi:hypothetical protein
MEKYYVYLHIKADSGEPFYVGKGKGRRVFNKISRNSWWKNIVNKHGLDIIFLEKDISEEKSMELEIYWINRIGRRDLGNGPLVNMTDGGDGFSNPNNDSRIKMSIKRKGKTHSEKTRAAMSFAQKRGKHSQAKKVIDEKTGIIYECIKDAAESCGIGYHSLKDKLSNRKNCVNNTTLRYYGN